MLLQRFPAVVFGVWRPPVGLCVLLGLRTEWYLTVEPLFKRGTLCCFLLKPHQSFKGVIDHKGQELYIQKAIHLQAGGSGSTSNTSSTTSTTAATAILAQISDQFMQIKLSSAGFKQRFV